MATSLRSRKVQIGSLLVILVIAMAVFLQSWLEKRLILRVSQFSDQWSSELSVAGLSLHLLRPSPYLTLKGISISTDEREPVLQNISANAAFSWNRILRGQFVLDSVAVNGGDVALVVDDQGRRNWGDLLELLLSLASKDGSDPPVDKINIVAVGVAYRHVTQDHIGLFDLSAEIDFNDTSLASTVALSGFLNSLPAAVTISSRFNPADTLMNGTATFDVTGSIAEVKLSIIGEVADLLDFDNIQATTTVAGDGVGSVLAAVNYPLTVASRIDMSGSIRRLPESIDLSEFALSVGDSSLAGDIRLETESDIATLSGQIIVENLLMDDFFPIEKSTRYGKLPSVNNISKSRASDKRRAVSKNRKLAPFFSSDRLMWGSLLSWLKLNVEVQLEAVSSRNLHAEELVLTVTADNKRADLLLTSDRFAGGPLELAAYFKTEDDGANRGKIQLRAQRTRMRELLSAADLPEAITAGRLSTDATFWFTGNSPAELAASLDGGMYVLIEEGQLDSMYVEMIGVDLMESLKLVANRDLQQTEIRCGYMDFEADSGIVSIRDFILDSEDTLFLGKGKVNLNDESITLTFEPHARDASFFAAPTALHIRGTLEKPRYRPGRTLYSRLAVAAALATLASPAAIVLPFVEIGDGDVPAPCEGLFDQSPD